MDEKKNDEFEINIGEIVYVLIYKLWIIIIVGMLTASMAGIYTQYKIVPVYASTAKLYVINRAYSDTDFITWSDLESSGYLTKDYIILVKSRPVTEEVIRNLGFDMYPEELAGMLEVNVPEETRVLEITAYHPNPEMAQLIVNEVAKVSSVRLVDIMQMEMINIVELGDLPYYPSSPNIRRNVLLGGAAGIFLSAALIVFLYLKNDSIKTSEDIEKYLGLTTLSSIPLDNGKNKIKNKVRQNSKKIA